MSTAEQKVAVISEEAMSLSARLATLTASGVIAPNMTSDQIRDLQILTDVVEAQQVLGDSENIAEVLSQFRKLFTDAQKDPARISQLVNAKNILLREFVNRSVDATGGKFDLQEIIPFEHICETCHGSGELYKFFKDTVQVECYSCDKDHDGHSTGRVTITCPACKGTREWSKRVGDHYEKVDCTKCDKDSKGKPTGKFTYKCRSCRGSGKRDKTVIVHIRSTTTCPHCGSLGFLTAEMRKKLKAKGPANPVITEDIGKKIKESAVAEHE